MRRVIGGRLGVPVCVLYRFRWELPVVVGGRGASGTGALGWGVWVPLV